jgi:hypothetical protein
MVQHAFMAKDVPDDCSSEPARPATPVADCQSRNERPVSRAGVAFDNSHSCNQQQAGVQVFAHQPAVWCRIPPAAANHRKARRRAGLTSGDAVPPGGSVVTHGQVAACRVRCLAEEARLHPEHGCCGRPWVQPHCSVNVCQEHWYYRPERRARCALL